MGLADSLQVTKADKLEGIEMYGICEHGSPSVNYIRTLWVSGLVDEREKIYQAFNVHTHIHKYTKPL